MDHREIAIDVRNVTKHFLLPHQKASSVKSFFLNPFSKIENEKQLALKDVSFQIKKGEFFGIVGRNGSGKSTLLKCISKIYAPDQGSIEIDGSLVPFIELGVGFNPELSGRDNVYLNGSLLGFSREEIDRMYEEIVDFAELHDFMDQKLKNYSSGMQVRLAFSIAVQSKGDILVLDEVLAVGDEAFQRKCFNYFAQVKNEKKTVILVTHAMGHVNRFCNRALLLDKGRVIKIGGSAEISDEYENYNLKSTSGTKKKEVQNDTAKEVRIEVMPVDEKGRRCEAFVDNTRLRFKVNISSKINLKDVFLGFSIHKPGGDMVFITTTEAPNKVISKIVKDKDLPINFDIQNIFPEDSYTVSVSLKSNDRKEIFASIKNITGFQIIKKGNHSQSFKPQYNIDIKQ